MTEQEFCEFYSSYYGEKITNIKQLTLITFDGEELKDLIEEAIKFNLKPKPCKCLNGFKKKNYDLCECCGGTWKNRVRKYLN